MTERSTNPAHRDAIEIAPTAAGSQLPLPAATPTTNDLDLDFVVEDLLGTGQPGAGQGEERDAACGQRSASIYKDCEREILDRLDIANEYRGMGLAIAGNPRTSGWQPCHAIDRADKSASAAIFVASGDARGRYRDMGGSGLSLTFWEFAARFGGHGDWREARKYFAHRAGVKLPGSKSFASATTPCPVCDGQSECFFQADGLHLCRRKNLLASVPGWDCKGPSRYDRGFCMWRRRGTTRNSSQASNRPATFNKAHADRRVIAPALDLACLAREFHERAGLGLFDLARIAGIREEALRFLEVGYQPQKGGAAEYWTFPERDGRGRIVQVVKRFRHGREELTAGGARGLTYWPEWWVEGIGPVFLPQSHFDVAALVTLGMSAIGRPSPDGCIDHIIELLRQIPVARPIVVIEVDDRYWDTFAGKWVYPSQTGSRLAAYALAKALGRKILVAQPPMQARNCLHWLAGQESDLTNDDSLRQLAQVFIEDVQAGALEVDADSTDGQPRPRWWPYLSPRAKTRGFWCWREGHAAKVVEAAVRGGDKEEIATMVADAERISAEFDSHRELAAQEVQG